MLARWTSALQRAKRAPGRRPAGAEAPYRGLARFEREDAFSPDGQTLAAGSADNTVRLWDVADPPRPSRSAHP